jgi:hypothetical protein
MSIARPMVLGDEPPVVLDNEDSAFATPPRPMASSVAAPIETRTYTPPADTVDTDGDGVADNGFLGVTPTYATRRPGSGGKIAMIAIPVAVVAVAAGLFLTSGRTKAPIADKSVAVAPAPAVTPAEPVQVAAATPAAAPSAMVATPAPVRAAAAPARHVTTARASTPRAARSADTSAVDTSAREAAPMPAPVNPAPPVLAVPAAPPVFTPTPAPTPAPEPTTPPQ